MKKTILQIGLVLGLAKLAIAGMPPVKITGQGYLTNPKLNVVNANQVNLGSHVTGTLPNGNTTATSANTASAIVARDASGNFSAGTITANASSMSGSLFSATSQTGGTSATTAQNFGINTTVGTTSAGVAIAGYAATPLISGHRALGTEASPSAVASGNGLLTLSGRGYDGTAWSGGRATISMAAEEAWTSTAQGTRITFNTTTNGTTTSTERMRITNAGNVGIGVTPVIPFHVRKVDTTAGTVFVARFDRTDTAGAGGYGALISHNGVTGSSGTTEILASGTSTHNLNLSGNNVSLQNFLNVTSAGIVSATNTTNSTSTSTGALVVSGGVGVGNSIVAGGDFTNGGYTQLGGGSWPTAVIARSAGRTGSFSATEDAQFLIGNMSNTAAANNGADLRLGARHTTGALDMAFSQIRSEKTGGSGVTGTQLRFYTGTAGGALTPTERFRVTDAGQINVLTTTDSSSSTTGSIITAGGMGIAKNLYVGSGLYVPTSTTPASASATCTTGQIAWDSNYLYVCVASNTWKRSEIATW